MATEPMQYPIGVKILAAAALVGIVAAIFLGSFPGIDLELSRLFWDPETRLFPLWQASLFRFANDLVEFLAVTYGIAVAIGFLATFVRGPIFLGLSRRAWLFLIASLALGPGLVANTVLKEISGRARPRHLAEFGGTLDFTAVFQASDQCTTNCSFISGDTAFAFSLLSLALLVPQRRRAVAAVLAFGAFIGAVRILQGAHFLSDVVFSGVFMAMVVATLHLTMVEPRPWAGGRRPVRRVDWRYPLWLFFRAQPEDLGVGRERED